MIFQDNKPGIGYFRSYFFRPKQKYLSAIKKIEKFQEAAEQQNRITFVNFSFNCHGKWLKTAFLRTSTIKRRTILNGKSHHRFRID